VANFRGFPVEALRFYEQLEADNSKSFWQANKQVYEEAVRKPMEALLTDLEPEFGAGRIFRPYRDVRFSADKSPYKTSCSVAMEKGYLALMADGLYVGRGQYMLDTGPLQRFREVVSSDKTGPALEKLVAALEKKGYEVGGEALKGAPRGYSNDHPRVRLLRNKGLHAGRMFAPEPWLHTPAAFGKVQKTLRDLGPLDEWLRAYVS
jgi:uncharacterized protein (TIGR02453 family)